MLEGLEGVIASWYKDVLRTLAWHYQQDTNDKDRALDVPTCVWMCQTMT